MALTGKKTGKRTKAIINKRIEKMFKMMIELNGRSYPLFCTDKDGKTFLRPRKNSTNGAEKRAEAFLSAVCS